MEVKELKVGETITFNYESLDYELRIVDGKPTVWIWEKDSQEYVGEQTLFNRSPD